MSYRFWFFVHMIPRFSFPDESSAVRLGFGLGRDCPIKIFTPSGSSVVRDVPRVGFHSFTNGFTRYRCARPASFPGDLSNENSKRDFCKSDDVSEVAGTRTLGRHSVPYGTIRNGRSAIWRWRSPFDRLKTAMTVERDHTTAAAVTTTRVYRTAIRIQ